MKQLENLMDYRQSIRVVDATLRDGGLVNDFRFTDEFARELYKTNIKAGVDYMEVGYKADKEMFDESEFGLYKFCDDDKIFELFGEKSDKIKLAVMADVGRCNYKEDIHEASNSPFSLIRVATYVHQMPGAIDMIEDAKNKGYEVTCNLMAISTAQENDIKVALDMLGKSSVDVIYIVDSYGALYPEQMSRVAELYREYADKYGKKLGVHTHNNQQLAFANTIEAVGDGVDYLDGTYAGMGRGAGNCTMENLLGFLRNPKYDIYPALKFIENYMVPLKESGVKWGYDWQYMMTGILNQHPRTAIAFTNEDRKDYTNFWKEISMQD
ncbi:MAG: aldolase catalytic domain-containing protein [Lachnospiraceae bacterium]|nr:aldolase catalytic domain-containing protein [Lachnospiraceae bacterium]